MPQVDLITTLTMSLAVALACGYVTFRLGLSPIVGYLLAGVVVGPHTPGLVANEELAEQFAEVGVILLMFGVGLQFHIKEILSVWRVAVPGALAQSLLATTIGALVARAFGWPWATCVVFGLCLSVASTVVLMRVLADGRDLHTPVGHVAVGWLVVEDLFSVLVLILLPAVVSSEGAGGGRLALAVAVSLAKVAAMIGVLFVAGDRLLPWALERVAATRSRELFTLTTLVLALGIAAGSAKLFGVSMALGAFLAGMIVGRSEFSLRAATEALPMRDAFAVLFFVSAGTLFDPMHLVREPGLVAATLAVILLAKPLGACLILTLLGRPARVAVSVGLALGQIGEFSFILVATAERLGLFDERASDTILSAALIAITVNPLLYRLAGPLERALRRAARLLGRPEPIPETAPEELEPGEVPPRAIVVGCGHVGRILVRLLAENHIEPVVLEMNLATVRRLGAEGCRAIYGDATHPQTLRQAGADGAIALFLTSSVMHGVPEAIRVARELNPGVFVFARAADLHEAGALRRSGADLVVSGEAEVATAMTEALLRQLGATPEQVDEERARIRVELYGAPHPHAPRPGWPAIAASGEPTAPDEPAQVP